MMSNLDYEGIYFPVSKKYFSKIEKTNNIFSNVFRYENELSYPDYASDPGFRNCMDLLWIRVGLIMSTSKILTSLCATKQSVKRKNTFVDTVYNVLRVKKLWQSIKNFA